MVQEQDSITIERPIDEVFAFLLDGMNNPLWRSSVIDSQRVAGKPDTYKQGMKGPTGRVDGDYEVTEIRPNQLIAMKAIAGMARPTSTFAFEAAGDATRVTFSLRFEGRGPAKLMEPLVATVMRREIGMLPNLKAHLERPRNIDDAAAGERPFSRAINPQTVISPSGAYSQGVLAGNLIFVAGQVGVDAGGKLSGDGGMADQTRQAITNISAVLADAGATLADVVSTTVYVKHFSEYRLFNQVWEECFGNHRPARATLRAELVLPQLLVEIQAIAMLPEAGWSASRVR